MALQARRRALAGPEDRAAVGGARERLGGYLPGSLQGAVRLRRGLAGRFGKGCADVAAGQRCDTALKQVRRRIGAADLGL